MPQKKFTINKRKIPHALKKKNRVINIFFRMEFAQYDVKAKL